MNRSGFAIRPPSHRFATSSLIVAAILATASCAPDSLTAPDPAATGGPRLLPHVLVAQPRTLQVCKSASSPAGTYDFSATRSGNVNDGDVFVPAVSLTLPTADGHDACAVVYTRTQSDEPGFDEPVVVVITEAEQAATELANIVVTGGSDTPPIQDPAPVVDLANRSVTLALNAFHEARATFFNVATSDGCTATIGWYKNKGAGSLPAGTFALSGKSYLEVLRTEPAGNPYFVLAPQFIAASQNVAAGASTPTAVDAALAAAAAYFAVATPDAPLPSGFTSGDIVALASTLDAYNNGLLGPPSCD